MKTGAHPEAVLRPSSAVDGSKSLAKALTILGSFTEAQPEWGVSELARHVGFGKSTVSTNLATLAAFGLVRQDPVTKRYRLGPSCMQLGYLASSRLVIRDVAYPYLEDLRSGSDWIVYMAIPWNDAILYVEALYPPRRRINYSAQGRVLPMYCTGIGKAALAWMPDTYIAGYLERTTLRPFTPATCATPDRLRDELSATKARGYAVDRQEHERGIQCVAAPVLHRDGRVMAAVSISGSAHVVPETAFPDIARKVIAAANEIARMVTPRL